MYVGTAWFKVVESQFKAFRPVLKKVETWSGVTIVTVRQTTEYRATYVAYLKFKV